MKSFMQGFNRAFSLMWPFCLLMAGLCLDVGHYGVSAYNGVLATYGLLCFLAGCSAND